MASRANRTFVTEWWWTVDRWILATIAALMVCGIVLTLAASPAVAERLNLSAFHFVNRHLIYLAVAVALMIATSFLTPRQVRRAALILFCVGMAGVVMALLFGAEVKGARRWIYGLQPSEFLKPGFVVLAAWAFSEGARRKDVPGTMLAMALLPVAIAPLILQPDFGQTMLIAVVWASLFFLAGVHWFWVAGIGALGSGGVLAAYHTLPHVRDRFDRFLSVETGPGAPDTFQMDVAMESFLAGGWFGKGPGEGTFKRILPDAHTDTIFAVSGEELGVIGCLVIVGLFACLVLRGLSLAARNEDPFSRFAIAGLIVMLGLQSSINMAVSLSLIPAKGMTLPFISYGGSSLLSLSLAMGFLIALSRRRPRSEFSALAPEHMSGQWSGQVKA